MSCKSHGIIIFDEERRQVSTVNVTIDATSIATGISAFEAVSDERKIDIEIEAYIA